MKMARVKELVESISYKPNYRFHFAWIEGSPIGILRITFDTQEPDNPEKPTAISVDQLYPEDRVRHMTEGQIKQGIAEQIERMELHESREWLKFEGVQFREADHGEAFYKTRIPPGS